MIYHLGIGRSPTDEFSRENNTWHSLFRIIDYKEVKTISSLLLVMWISGNIDQCCFLLLFFHLLGFIGLFNNLPRWKKVFPIGKHRNEAGAELGRSSGKFLLQIECHLD